MRKVNLFFHLGFGVFTSKFLQKKSLISLLIITFAIMACTKNQDKTSQLPVLDENNKIQFALTKTENQFKVNSTDVDAYLHSSLKLPKTHSLDYVKVGYNEELSKGVIIVQYLDLDLNQVPIGLTFLKKIVNGEEVLSIDSDKKYKCQPATGSNCTGCCGMKINSEKTEVTCDCDPPDNESNCWKSPNGCEIAKVKEQENQGN